jgi:hypothetical protein
MHEAEMPLCSIRKAPLGPAASLGRSGVDGRRTKVALGQEARRSRTIGPTAPKSIWPV